ncbi:MAG: SprT-like domain-containing protein [Pseudomonadota bacterium]
MYITETATEAPDVEIKPTQETYDALQWAFNYFNWTLFERSLPNCLITLQRRGRTYGYFHRERFVREDGTACDEIALNPQHFQARSEEEVLSTVLHEMVHLWQFHFGKPGRGRYHNRQWADKMKALALQPSDTGKPGGHETGDSMSHYVVEGGLFEQTVARLMDEGFMLTWQDKAEEPEPVITPGGAEGDGGPSPKPKPSKSGVKIKYSCPTCGLNAWAKHEAYLVCGHDRSDMVAETADT